jgi:hypothetical protein
VSAAEHTCGQPHGPWHSHQCSKCGTTWEHRAPSFDCFACHACPECSEVEWLVLQREVA